MDKQLVGLGVGAGAVAGMASFTYSRVAISPVIDAAIDYEAGRSHAEAAMLGEGHSHSHEIFSRAWQENLGAGVGIVVFGMVMGALFAVALAVTLRVLRGGPRPVDGRTAAVGLAAAAFVVVALLPALCHPPNPPGVGLEETMAARTTAHLTVVAASLVVAGVAAFTALRSTPRLGAWRAAALATVGYVVAMILVNAVTPTFAEVPEVLTDATGAMVYPGFPAEVLSDFRVDSLVNQAILWAVIGMVAAALLPRTVTATPTAHQSGAPSGRR